MSFGMHVHIKGKGETLPDLFNATRELIPEIMAISASSPFYQREDTGLCSWRFSMLGHYRFLNDIF